MTDDKPRSRFARPGVLCPADHIVEVEGVRYYARCVLCELHGGDEHMDSRGNRWPRGLWWPHLRNVYRPGPKKKPPRY